MSLGASRDGEHLGDLLSGLIDGELEATERAMVQEHLTWCPQCAIELDEIRMARRALRQLPAVEPPTRFLSRLFDDATDPVGPGQAEVVELASARSRFRGRRVPIANAAAAAAILVVVAMVSSNAASSDSPTQVPLASRQHANAVVALVGSGSLREDTAPFTMPNALAAAPTSTAERLPTVDAARLAAPYQAPPTLAGGYTLVEAFDLPGGVHLVYRKAGLGLSIFEEEGHIDDGALPAGGTRVVFGDDEGWRWEGPVIAGRVVVTEHQGVVITAIGDEPGDAVLEAVRSFPGPRSLSNVQRLRRFADRALEGLHLAG